MRTSTFTAMLATLAATTVSAWKCEMDDMRYIGQVATLVPSVQTHPGNETLNMTISGSLSVTDACNFVIQNFTFTPYVNETYWYGIRDVTYNKGMISNDTVFESNGTIAPFRFVDYPIARGWDDVDTLVLFSRTFNIELARATLNLTEIQRIRNNTVPVDPTDTTTTPSPSSTPSSNSGSTVISFSSKTSIYFVLLSTFLVYLFA